MGLLGLPAAVQAANPSGDLRIEILTAYNLVVDSNAGTPSSYAPESAYIGAKFYNDGTNALTNVWAYIGDYTAGTPGTYPSRTQAGLTGPLAGGAFALTHDGGRMGATDATRYLGTIQPGESVAVYWLADYPQLDIYGTPVWGDSVKPDDDLWLKYDIWATAMDGAAPLQANDSRTMTLRNEISAMANKIWPNTANKVPDEYQDLLNQYVPTWTNTTGYSTAPGGVLVTEGIWYDLGNVGAGFDNDGDLVPDRNAWLQPVGDPGVFDPSCFRMVANKVMVIVKLNDGTEQVIVADDQLYFTQIPENNRGAIGYVQYEFMSVGAGCQSTLTPYQEVASGYDNEKFNGDYGAPGQTLVSTNTRAGLTKTVDKLVTRPGSNLYYTVGYTNAGSTNLGRPDLGLPLVVQDSIPTGTLYVAGSATPSNVLPAGVSSYTVYYSTNHGLMWSLTEPAPATNVTDVQWWLSDPLAPGAAGLVRFGVTVKNPWPYASPVVTNTAGLSFGNTAPFLWAGAQTLLLGNNTLGDRVWRDDGAGGGYLGNQLPEGAEAGITGVAVRVYYDANSDGAVDSGDILFTTVNTGANGIYSATNLPDGYFIVAVETTNSNIPFGYTPTTPTTWTIGLDVAKTNVNAVTNLTADFGFAPALTLVKSHTSTNAIREGQTISYNLTVSNNLPGNGTGGGALASFTAWAQAGTATDAEWHSYTNSFVPVGPDGIYTTNHFDNAEKLLTLSNFTVGVQNGSVSNVAVTMPIVMVAPLGGDDELRVTVARKSPATTIFTSIYRATNLVTGTMVIPMTGTFAWAWTDFATNYTITLGAAKNSGGAAGGDIRIDCVGFEVTGNWTTGVATATTTLNPVPLTDSYDPAKLLFLGAQPPVTSSTTNSVGTLFWNNVGPIYPGGTSTVAVTFKLLEPPNNTNTVVTNTTWVTNAYFTGGARANNATSSVIVTQYPAATVGDYIWRDLNGDGVQNETNTGIANVAVTLTPPAGIDLGNGAGAPVTNWTSTNGYYLFESIPVTGVYTVRVVTATLPGGTGTNTFDEDGVKDNTHAVYLDIYAAPASTNNLHLTTDFGYQVQSSIIGTIWHDYDRGQESYREDGEDWLTNVTVYLCASPSPCGPGASIATNYTDTNGFFRFTGNYTGTYTVSVATNTGMLSNGTWRLSFDTDGTNTANYSAVTVPSGGVGRVDYSYFRTGPYRIGDTLFYDWNSNGVQEVATEEGILNVTVRLYEDANSNGVVDAGTDAYIATTVTTTNGYYAFTNLFATNTYLVVVDRTDADLPADYLVTADPWGAKDGRSVVTIINADRMDQDFGFWPYGSGAIGDTVWRDLNSDGVQAGPQETGISNILVSLYADLNNDGTYLLLHSTNTSVNGTYLFSGLPDGKYRVTVDAADTDLPVDAFSHVYHATTATNCNVTISGGSTYLDADFGFAPYGAIGDTVFWDANRNGTQDYNEDGVPGVTVQLYNDANGNRIYDTGETLLASDTTDTNGLYLFDGLLPGNYAVRVVTASGPLLGTEQTADPNSDGLACSDPENTIPCDNQYGLYLAAGQNFMGADFGYAANGVIGDTLWIDTNNNGVRDTNELGLPYISVVLYSNGTAVATNVTDADGYYLFSGLPDATYGVRVATNDTDFPAGLTNTWTADGTFDNYTTNIVLSGGTVVSIGGFPCTGCSLNVDFGYRYAGNNSLSGTIGLDLAPYDGVLNGTNAHGVAAGEYPYAGVAVYLYLWNDDGDSVIEAGEYRQISSTTTATNGDYAFTGLPNGDGNDKYVVTSFAPEDYLKLTTTNGSIAGVTVYATTNSLGDAVSARLAINIAANITGMDFAYRSTRSYDYGDLPETYGTLAPDGARHLVPAVANLYLGAGVDTENNGAPSTGADGDDLAGSDDENGVFQVTNSLWRTGSNGGSVRVTVGAGSGWLVGYIDFNHDGDFADASEMVCSLAVSNTGGNGAGVYTNTFAVPAGAFSTTSSTPLYARYRLYPEKPLFPELSFNGTADNGEVEDYLWHLAGLGDYVWYDVDDDGVQDAGELPIPGVRVFLDLNSDGVYQTNEPAATTGSDGAYGIGGLVTGTYSVRVDTNTLPANVTPTYDFDGIGTPHQAAVTLTNLDQFFPSADFGYAPPINIGDRVWFDENRDGIQNASETNNISGIPVALLDTNGNIVAETTTAQDGRYLFAQMPARQYVLRFDLTSVSTNETISAYNASGDDETDSDAISGRTGDYAWTTAVSVAPGQTTLAVDLGITTRGSTRSELGAVWGEWANGQGRVAWRTESEYGTAGFFVYRVAPRTGAETRLNTLLQPSAFQENGAVYSLAESAAEENGIGTYRLEEVELTGETRDLGMHEIRFVQAAPATKAVRTAGRAVQARAPQAAAVGATTPSSVLKVHVQKDGIYSVALPAVADGFGRTLADVRALAKAGSLRITLRGVPVPVRYDEPRSRLVFHGSAPAADWYVHDNVYLISAGAGLAMPRREPQATGGATVFPVALHFEEDLFLFSMTQMPEDFYFWAGVVSGFGDISVQSFPLDLSGYAGGDLKLKVRLMGWSSSTNTPDHLAKFGFNGTETGSIAFDGQDAAEAEMTIPAALVRDGANTLTVEGVLQPGRSESFFVVDWIEADFNRSLAPRSETADFRAGGAAAVSAAAFADPWALALDESGQPTWIADENGTIPAKAWSTASGNERFAVIETDAIPELNPEPAAADAWFLAATNRLDYLVIAPRELAETAQALADYRSAQGLRSAVAVFEDACDLLADGFRTPAAVPALLRYAMMNWEQSPAMVVLAGNGNYDYRGILADEPNLLPPMLVQTPSGVCASDGLLADTGGDTRPDLAIGRLPARSSSELLAMINKIEIYEQGFGAPWQNEILMAADKADSIGSFSAANDRLAALVSTPYSVPERIDLDRMAVGPARTNFLRWFQQGAGFIHYTGHGGMKNLGTQNLLTATNISAMANADRPPIVMTLTCLAARYEVPATDSLGELLLRQAGGGAVAVLGPSGLSRNAPATELGEAFYRAILKEGEGRLGPAFLKARRSQAEDVFSKDTFAVYNLLGDPALRVAGNDVTNSQPTAARITLAEMTQVFDGNPHAVTATTVPAGLAVRLTYNGSSLPPVAAGTYAVTATVATASYEATTVGTLVVAKAAASITLHNLSQIYAGGPRTVTATTVPDGLSVWLAYDGAGDAPVAAGTYGVTATIADANYAGAASGVLEVAKAPASVNLAGLVQTYDGNAKTVAVSTQPAGLAVEIRYDGLATPPAAAGVHVVTAQVVDSNYQGAVTARMDILRANAEVVLGSLEQTYDGQPRPATAMTQPMELAVDFTYNGAAAAPVSAGRYEVRGTVSDPNWQGSDSGWLVISKGNQTIQVADIGNAAPGEVLALSATASSGLPVKFELIRGPATLDSSGTVLRLTGEGEVEVQARQAGDANWNAAPTVPQIIRVAYPPPRLELSKGTVLVREAGEGRLFVRLASAPKSNTVVAVSRSAGSAGIVVRSGATRTFTPADWNVWQPVTLAAADDSNGISETAVIQLAVTGGESWLVDAVAMDDDLGSNLALASSGTAIKGTGANQLAQMIDGNHLSSTNYGWTVWTNPAIPGTATLDLKTTATVSRVRILNWDWVYRVHRYRLDGSVDGNTWFPVADASGEDHQGWDEWPVGQTPVRYLRFTGLSNSVNQCVVISELEIYGIRPDAAAVLPQPVLSKDVVKIREGSAGRFFLHLDQAPVSPVVFHVTLQSGDAGISLQSGAALTFTPANWSEWQGVTLAAAEDENRVGETAVFRISATGYADRIVSAVALDDDDGRNFALAASGATAKGLRASQAGALIDGIYNVSTNYGWTVWTNLAQPGTLTIDLKDTTTVSRIRLLNWDWVYRVNRYQIETSPNGTDWTMWADASADGHHGWEEWPAPERLARYVKFTGLSNSANQCVVISELEVYGALPVFSQTAVNVREGGEGRFFMRMDSAPSAPVSFGISVDSAASGVQVQGGAVLKFTAQNWSEWQAVTLAAAEDTNRTDELATIRISAPGYAARQVTATVLDDDIGVNLALAANGAVVKGTRASQAAALIDGVHAASTNYGWTVWTNLALPGTITLDLKTTATVSRIRLLNWDWVYRVHRYRIESSVDGLNWRTLADASQDDHHGWDDWPVANLGMRYVRFTGLSNSVNQCVLISELEVYGADAGLRVASVKSKTAGPDSARVQDVPPYPVTVVTSEDAGPEHTNGWVVVDGDPNTGWAGKPGTGGWIAIGYNTTVAMTNLVVELEADASVQIRGLFSMDGNNWEELPEVADGLPVEFNYLWLFVTANGQAGPAPRIMEIRPEE